MPSKRILLLDTLLNTISMLSRTPLNYWAEFAVDILFGLFLFSIIEYSFHRWLSHGSVQIMAQGHRAHHENPLGYDSLQCFLPALILMALSGLLVLLMPAKYAFLLTGIITLNYVIYGLSHFTIHHHRFHYVLARSWAANHHIHHYHADTNFGVTTPLWDIVFGTRYRRAS
jgi:sterol desaturase/sphingolipid hydroxylase (fatty acid hydroxylase superfamily)